MAALEATADTRSQLTRQPVLDWQIVDAAKLAFICGDDCVAECDPLSCDEHVIAAYHLPHAFQACA